MRPTNSWPCCERAASVNGSAQQQRAPSNQQAPQKSPQQQTRRSQQRSYPHQPRSRLPIPCLHHAPATSRPTIAALRRLAARRPPLSATMAGSGSGPSREAAYDTTVTGSVGRVSPAPPPCPLLPSVKSVWTPNFFYLRSSDDLRNRFLVKVSMERLGQTVVVINQGFYGRNCIEDVCSTLIATLRKSGDLPLEQLVSCLFFTVEERPAVIPNGVLLADLYNTNCSDDCLSLELRCRLVAYNVAERFFINPHEAPEPVVEVGDLPDALGDLPDALGDLPDALGNLPDALGKLPAALGDSPAAVSDAEEGKGKAFLDDDDGSADA